MCINIDITAVKIGFKIPSCYGNNDKTLLRISFLRHPDVKNFYTGAVRIHGVMQYLVTECVIIVKCFLDAQTSLEIIRLVRVRN